MTNIIHEQRINGWWPKQSPTGRFVAHGNCAVRVYDTVLNITTEVPHVLPWQPSDGGGVGAMWPVGWITPDELVVTTQLEGNTRRVDRYHAIFKTLTPINLPPNQAPGYGGGAAKGHIMSSIPGPWVGDLTPDKFYIYADGVDVTPTTYVARGPVLFDGVHYLYRIPTADRRWPSVIHQISNHQIVKQYECPVGDWRWNEMLFTDLTGRPWSISTAHNRAVVQTPWGEDLYGPLGEPHGGLSFYGTEVLVWTIRFEDELTPVLLGRPVGAMQSTDPAIVVKGVWQSDLQVAVNAIGYQLVGFNGGGTPGIPAGTLTVGRVPLDIPRVVYTPPTAPPVEPPVVEPPPVDPPPVDPPVEEPPPVIIIIPPPPIEEPPSLVDRIKKLLRWKVIKGWWEKVKNA